MEKRKHFGSFILAGGSAFVVNAVVLFILAEVLGLNPYLAQVFGIWASITTSWVINRTKTFPVEQKPTLMEYTAYCISMLFSSAVNYACFVLMLSFGAIFLEHPILALIPATLISMNVSYFCMKYFVFK